MGRYVVREGHFFGIGRKYRAGDVVELTDDEYRGLEDKLMPYVDWVGESGEVQEEADDLDDFLMGELDEITQDILISAGFATAAQIRAANDNELLAVKGIATGRLGKIRSVFGYG